VAEAASFGIGVDRVGGDTVLLLRRSWQLRLRQAMARHRKMPGFLRSVGKVLNTETWSPKFND
jgi:hypothetical protein